MRVTKFVGPARWMKLIAEQDETRDPGGAFFSCSHLRSNSPAHRLSTNRDTITLQLLMFAGCVDDRNVTGFQLWFRIRHVPSLFHVNKIEGNHINTALGQSVGKQAHETTQLVRTGAMTENQSNPPSDFLRSEIHECSHAIAVVDGNLFGSGFYCHRSSVVQHTCLPTSCSTTERLCLKGRNPLRLR